MYRAQCLSNFHFFSGGADLRKSSEQNNTETISGNDLLNAMWTQFSLLPAAIIFITMNQAGCVCVCEAFSPFACTLLGQIAFHATLRLPSHPTAFLVPAFDISIPSSQPASQSTNQPTSESSELVLHRRHTNHEQIPKPKLKNQVEVQTERVSIGINK